MRRCLSTYAEWIHVIMQYRMALLFTIASLTTELLIPLITEIDLLNFKDISGEILIQTIYKRPCLNDKISCYAPKNDVTGKLISWCYLIAYES